MQAMQRMLQSLSLPPPLPQVYSAEVPLARAKAINGLRAVFGEVGDAGGIAGDSHDP
jgi:hypothetical protein